MDYSYPTHQPSPSSSLTRHFVKLIPTTLITLGSIMIANVAWPIISYQLFISPQIQKGELITPISQEQTVFYTLDQTHSNPNIELPTSPLTSVQAMDLDIDYTKASNWFPNQSFPDEKTSKITHYTISIPQVNIEEAVVAIGGEDLSESLVQYPGTAYPGQLGSPVIFGHSVLRQFYNPSKTNKRRYISIFSKIMTLKNQDEIIIDFDGIRYNYTVREKFEVKPDDVFILQQRYNTRELKLVTCVPEGTYLRRGVIVAELQDINSTRQIH